MSEIKVETGIPIPLKRRRGVTGALRNLKRVGDSVFLPKANPRSVPQCAGDAGLRGKYTARTVEGGVRVWRTKE